MWLPWVRLKAGVARLFGSELAKGINLDKLSAICNELDELLSRDKYYSGWREGMRTFPSRISRLDSPQERIKLAQGRLRVMSTGNSGWNDIVLGFPDRRRTNRGGLEVDTEATKRFHDLSEQLRRLCASDIYWLRFRGQHTH